jgi:hypothetical protein
VDYLPGEVDWSRPIKLSSDIKRRDWTQVFPPNTSVTGINGASMSATTEIKLQDNSRFMDTATWNLEFSIGNIVLPACSANFVCCDGPYAPLARVNVSIGGVNISTGVMDLNKHLNARYLNQVNAQQYINDANTLNPGNSKLLSVLNSTSVPQTKPFYSSLADSPGNLINPYNQVAGGNAATDITSAALKDAYGFLTSIPTATTILANNANYYGYNNVDNQDRTTQFFSIPLGEICPFFGAEGRYLPLFLFQNVIIQIYWASPQTCFVSDASVAASGVIVNVASYDVKNIKLSGDLITASESLVNGYKLKASSEDGIILPYNDFLVQNGTFTSAGSARNFQCNLSTQNLKSVLVYQQPVDQQNKQNYFSNSNFIYNGIRGLQMVVNNQNVPSNPLNTSTEIQVFNARSRGTIGNQLSGCVAANKWVSGKCECIPTAAGALATDIPAAITSWFFYNSMENVINESVEVTGNGQDLKSHNSVMNIRWQEDTPNTKMTAILTASQNYNLYSQMTFLRALVIRLGNVELVG